MDEINRVTMAVGGGGGEIRADKVSDLVGPLYV